MHKRILWLITARSGSKSIPDKNIKRLGSLPLIAYRIKSALKSRHESDVWVSTDSKVYSNIAKEYKAKVPFLRPQHLSTDCASSNDVVLHAMKFANKMKRTYDFIGLLEPTSPFISTGQIDNALTQLINDVDACCIVSVRESRPNTIFIQNESYFLNKIAKQIKGVSRIGRQEFKKQITPSGGFYISRWNNFKLNRTFYTNKTIGYLVDELSGLEIDEPIDFDFARFLLTNKKLNG